MQDVTKDRYKYIGGSDIPIIMGLSPFKTRWQLLQEKAQLAESDFQGNKYTEYGNIMEPKIREYINAEFGYSFTEDKFVSGNLRYHADGYDSEKATVLEIKTTSQTSDDVAGYKKYVVQLAFGMYMARAGNGELVIYKRPDTFDETLDKAVIQVISIDFDTAEPLINNEILPAVEKFSADLEQLRANPFLSEEQLQPKELQELSFAVVALEQELSAYKEIEKQYKDTKAALKEAMEKYNVKTWTTPNGAKITLVADGEDKMEMNFDEAKLKKEEPEIYNKYLSAKVKKGRQGFVRITI